MYRTIIDPKTGKAVSIHSPEGISIFLNFVVNADKYQSVEDDDRIPDDGYEEEEDNDDDDEYKYKYEYGNDEYDDYPPICKVIDCNEKTIREGSICDKCKRIQQIIKKKKSKVSKLNKQERAAYLEKINRQNDFMLRRKQRDRIKIDLVRQKSEDELAIQIKKLKYIYQYILKIEKNIKKINKDITNRWEYLSTNKNYIEESFKHIDKYKLKELAIKYYNELVIVKEGIKDIRGYTEDYNLKIIEFENLKNDIIKKGILSVPINKNDLIIFSPKQIEYIPEIPKACILTEVARQHLLRNYTWDNPNIF